MILVFPLGLTWLLAIVLSRLDGRRHWVDRLGIAGLGLALAGTLWLAVRVFTRGPVVMVTGGWPAGIGISLRADPLGVIFAVLANGLLLAALIYEDLGGTEERAFPALVLFLATGLNGLFLSSDVFNFYVFFEVSMAASFVIATYGQKRREIRDALTFAVVNLLGSAIFLVGVVSLYHVTGTLDMQVLAVRIDAAEPASVILIATLVFVAFGVKLGLFPFHFWLPPVYRGVRPVVAAILSGVLANIGSYGWLRFGADLLQRELEFASSLLLVLGIASVLYGALLAVSRKTEQEVLAYSSISQAGYILIAVSIAGTVGYAAAILYAVVNALNKTVLFLAAGLRGWLVGAAFVLGALSIAGVPPAAGFLAKAALFQASIAEERTLLTGLLLLGSALSFVYMFQIYQLRFWAGPRRGVVSRLAQRLLVLSLAGLLVAFGLWPELLLGISHYAAEALQRR